MSSWTLSMSSSPSHHTHETYFKVSTLGSNGRSVDYLETLEGNPVQGRQSLLVLWRIELNHLSLNCELFSTASKSSDINNKVIVSETYHNIYLTNAYMQCVGSQYRTSNDTINHSERSSLHLHVFLDY